MKTHDKVDWSAVTDDEPGFACRKGRWCRVSPDGSHVACRRQEEGSIATKMYRDGRPAYIHRRDGHAGPGPAPPSARASRAGVERADDADLDRMNSRLLSMLLLSDRHRRGLHARGLTDEDIAREGFGSLPLRGRRDLLTRMGEDFPAERLQRLPGVYVEGGQLKLAGSSGLAVPVRNPEGLLVGILLRPDDPGDGAKYLWLSSATKGRGGPGPGAPTHVPRFAGDRATVRVTEGALKADVATALSGVLTVGTAGLPGEGVVPALEALDVRKVLLSVDSDKATNEHVRRAEEDCLRALLAAGFEVVIEEWDREHKGIDDALKAGASVRTRAVEMNDADRNGEAPADPIECLVVPEPEPWPVMGKEAYHGVLGGIVRAIEPETESDPVAILIGLLACVGNVVGRNPHLVIEGRKHFANLFAVLVGETANGRKGTSEGRVLGVMKLAAERWARACVQHGVSSGEGIVHAIRDRTVAKHPVREKGVVVGYEDVIEDHGVEDKRLLLRLPEYSVLLKVMTRNGNTSSSVVRDAWDGDDLQNPTKNSPARATEPHVSLMGHITAAELSKLLGSVEAANGFGNRHLWMCVRRTKFLPNGGRDLDTAPLADALGDAIAAARDIGAMRRSAAADALWDTLYRGELNAEKGDGVYAHMTARAAAQTARLSLLYAALDGSAVIEEAHLKAAIAVWRYADASAKRLFASSEGDQLADQLFQMIRGMPGGMTKTEMHAAFKRNKRAEDIAAGLFVLLSQGRARRLPPDPTARGRPTERWFAAG